MGNIAVDLFSGGDAGRLENFVAALPTLSYSWNRALTPESLARLEMQEVAKGLESGGEVWVASNDGGICGMFMLSPLEWASSFFGVKMGQATMLRMTNTAAMEPLLNRLRARVDALGYEHVHVIVNTLERDLYLALQDEGWRVVWAVMRMACPTSEVDIGSFHFRQGSLEMVEYNQQHLPVLLEISSRLPEHNWMAHERRLPEEKRKQYKIALTENCCTTDFANVALTLLDEGTPAGFYASRIDTLPEFAGGTVYAEDKSFFLDPGIHGKGLGRFLTIASFQYMVRKVDYITTRIRLQSPPMLHLALNLGFKSLGGELYLSLSK